ncbi:MAG: tetratricopeptide repeat protein [Cyclobacteriaceae bacterium]|nr:tetratricopeptide repeat protein [Cyclobacteriaceae bacterium]
MFGLFSSKEYLPTVTAVDKDWVEQSFIWFLEVFGFERLRQQPFYAPAVQSFPYDNLKDLRELQQLLAQLCGYLNLNPHQIDVKFFDDLDSKQWTVWNVPPLNETEISNQVNAGNLERFTIELAKSNLNHPQLLIAVLAHELTRVKLLEGNSLKATDPDLETMTDLISIFFGFGIFVANSVLTTEINWITRNNYLPNEIISYANALVCHVTMHNSDNYTMVLNRNTNEQFRKNFEYLTKTNDTALDKFKVQECEKHFLLNSQVTKGFADRDFEKVIEGNKKILQINPRNNYAFNNLGYTLLQQKKYTQAIESFTKAIDLDPYWDYPFNNRGYCKLQLNDLENAYLDLHASFEMDPQSPFNLRNMGAYYLKTNDFEKALHHFEEVEKIGPETDLINFYLGQAHLKLGNLEKSKLYFEKSIRRNEHNDSMIE